MFCLKLIQSPDKEFLGTFTSFKHQILVGRSHHCDLIIKDPLVEKKHLVISQVEDQITVHGYSKKFHYLKNEKKVLGETRISENDSIQIGNSCFQLTKIEKLDYNPDNLVFLKQQLEKINNENPKLAKVLQDIKQEIIKIQVEQNES